MTVSRSSLPLHEISRALAAFNVSKLALADVVYSKRIVDLVAFQSQLQSLTAPFLGLQETYARLLSQFDVSRLVVADQVLSRLGAQSSVLNHLLIQQVTFPAAEVAQQMLSAFAPTARMMAQFQAQLDQVARMLNQSLWGTFEPLRQLAERVGRTQAVCDAFLAYGLWLAPSMPEGLIRKVVNLHQGGAGSGTVHSVVSRYYAKSDWKLLDRVLEACKNNPNLVRRIEPIRQALQAHRQGLYYVAIPTLLLHVEGIAADYVKVNSLLPKVDQRTRKMIVTALQDTSCSPLDVTTYAGVTGLLDYVQNSMYIFVDFDKDHQRPLREKSLKAHAIRHGRQIAFGSRMNSLRLFLIIDVLSLLE